MLPQLHGVYRATSNGRENISLTAWKGSAPTPSGASKEAGDIEVRLLRFETAAGALPMVVQGAVQRGRSANLLSLAGG